MYLNTLFFKGYSWMTPKNRLITPKNGLKTQESTQNKQIKICFHENLFKKVHLIYAFKNMIY